jgi:hypothetical protein
LRASHQTCSQIEFGTVVISVTEALPIIRWSEDKRKTSFWEVSFTLISQVLCFFLLSSYFLLILEDKKDNRKMVKKKHKTCEGQCETKLPKMSFSSYFLQIKSALLFGRAPVDEVSTKPRDRDDQCP